MEIAEALTPQPHRQTGYRPDDARLVDAVVAIEILYRAGLTKMLDPERYRPVAVNGTKPGKACGMPVGDGNKGAMGRKVGEQGLDMTGCPADAAPPCPLGRGPAGVQAIRGGDGQHADIPSALAEQPGRRNHFRRDRALIDQHDIGIRTGRLQPIATIDDALAEVRVAARRRLFERPRRQPQIDGAARLVAQPGAFVRLTVAIALHIIERPVHDDGQFVEEGRLETRQPILADTDQRRGDRLVCAALRRQRDAGRRADDHEAGILVAGIVQRIETAADEGIINRADRQQALAEQRMGETGGSQQQEEVHLGNAEFDMLPLRREMPFLRGRHPFVAKRIGPRIAGKQATPVDPGAEIGRDSDIRGRRHDPGGQCRVGLCQCIEDLAEAGLRRQNAILQQDRPRCRNALRLEASRPRLKEWYTGEESLCIGAVDHCRKRVPLRAGCNLHRRLEIGHLACCHQAGMIVLVTGKRRAPALDRIGQEDRRPVVVNAVERIGQRRQAMAAEIVHEVSQFGIGTPLDQRRHAALVADLVEQSAPPGGPALEGQCGIKLVRAGVDPVLQARSTRLGERRVLQRAVFDDHDIPAEGLENSLDTLPQTFAHHAVKALAIVVDDPPGIAQVMLPAFLQALVDIAFIQLGITDQGNHPPERTLLRPGSGGDVILYHRRKGRHADAEADRTGGEIDIVDILGAARIGLRTAETTKFSSLSRVWLPIRYWMA